MDLVTGAVRGASGNALAAATTVYGAATAEALGQAAASTANLAHRGGQEAAALAHQHTTSALEKGQAAAAGAMEQQQAAVAAVRDGVQAKTNEYRKLIELFIKRKIHRYLGQVVDKIPGIMKDSTVDPDMPQLVARAKDRAIDAIWPDIKKEIMWEIAAQLDGKEVRDEDLPPGPGPVRAFLRYHLYPYDKTIWGHLRDPVWILFTLVSLIPWAGMCPLIFLLIFVVIDKGDEFQLTQFILQFKGTQFISHGIIKTITGFFVYLNCVTVPAEPGKHYCDSIGPGNGGGYEVVVLGWLLQVLLIWCAFACIPFSQSKGRTKLKNEDEIHSDTTIKGGYLRYLLIYDMVCFLACMGVLVYVLSTRAFKPDDWPVRHAFFATQVVYGYTSSPFFLFTLPVLKTILTHTMPTAYDKEGRARKSKGPPIPPKEPRAMPTFITLDDARQLSEKAQQIFAQGKSASALFAEWRDDGEEQALRQRVPDKDRAEASVE